MLTVNLGEELAEQVTQIAAAGERSPDDVVEEAVRRYLGDEHERKIRAESDAYQEQIETLAEQYAGHYIAMHDGKVIDHDPDLRTLHLRVFQRLGHTPVLLKKVGQPTRRELRIRSPRVERHA